MRRSRLIIHRSFASEHAAGRRAGAEVTVATAVARPDPLPQIIFEFMLWPLHPNIVGNDFLQELFPDFAMIGTVLFSKPIVL